jgi:hypothetical protein
MQLGLGKVAANGPAGGITALICWALSDWFGAEPPYYAIIGLHSVVAAVLVYVFPHRLLQPGRGRQIMKTLRRTAALLPLLVLLGCAGSPPPPVPPVPPSVTSTLKTAGCDLYAKLSWLVDTANAKFAGKYAAQVRLAEDALAAGVCADGSLAQRGEAIAFQLVASLWGLR